MIMKNRAQEKARQNFWDPLMQFQLQMYNFRQWQKSHMKIKDKILNRVFYA